MNGSTPDYSLYLWLSFLMMGVIFAAHLFQAWWEKRTLHQLLSLTPKLAVSSPKLNADLMQKKRSEQRFLHEMQDISA